MSRLREDSHHKFRNFANEGLTGTKIGQEITATGFHHEGQKVEFS